jgi:hypothetical protein
MDDMERIIKELSNKISRMELDQAKNEHFPRKDFRRNLNLQNQQRQIKNEDKKIQAPFKSENFIGGEDVEDFEELEEDINNLGNDCLQPFLTRQDYEKSTTTKHRYENNKNNGITKDSTYQGIADDIMAELHQKYNLRPRNKSLTTPPVKKILPRGEIDESVSKNVEKQTIRTKTADTQPTNTKSTDTPVVNTQKVEVPTTETKTSQQKKDEKKSFENQTLEINKTI